MENSVYFLLELQQFQSWSKVNSHKGKKAKTEAKLLKSALYAKQY